MSGGGGGGNSRELDQTPTWAVASVCGVIVLISILLEMGLHKVGEWFAHRKKKAMVEALEKVKAELMVLGFISLLLVFGQSYIIKICISEAAADTMLPCRLKKATVEVEIAKDGGHGAPAEEHGAKQPEEHFSLGTNPFTATSFSVPHRMLSEATSFSVPHRMLSEATSFSVPHRMLSEANMNIKCPPGKVSLISINALHQLHIFIFFLAVFHVCYSATTMALGRAKSNFFRQFFRSVRRADYCALRHSFVNVHLAPGSKFDFQKYIKRSLEDDFKVIVGISPILWASALIFLLVNINGMHTMLWISIMPLVILNLNLEFWTGGWFDGMWMVVARVQIILSVGTKLQGIICRMAIDITERHAVIQGIPLVQVSDSYFWFSRPTFVLFLSHFTLFQNAFQIIYFLWILYEYGMDSCFNDSKKLVVARLCLGAVVQVLCSYVTLPLYALVSQMGSTMKQSIFDDQTSKALKSWRAGVKKKPAAQSSKHGGSPSGSPRAGSPKGAHEGSTGIALTQKQGGGDDGAP
uniref:MLO-like protein n=1 Tax=Aegilops tauschii TaxID=37682 RepID=N1QTY7_AEGTA